MAEDRQIEDLLKSGAFPDEVSAEIRRSLQQPAQGFHGQPLAADEALADWEITETDIAQAQADWVATAPDWAAGLLDAKPVADIRPPTARKGGR